MVRSEFVRLPLIIDAHMRTWNYIKYLKNKPDDSLVKISDELESSPENNDLLFNICDKTYCDIIGKNMKKGAALFKSGKSFLYKNIKRHIYI